VILSLETIDWYSFLGRPPLPKPSLETVSSLVQQPILITGAGGSIGSALALRLASHGAHIVLLESSENNLYDLQRDLANPEPSSRAIFYLGSVSDRTLLDEIFSLHRPHLVFHAAAYKHVPIIEEHPLAAIANNIFGTQCLCDAASAHRARVILLSTDKAVAPASMMGATKRVAEQTVLTSGGTVLRLGNILASRGSVTEVFARQIAAGLPLTVTDPAARRYFLTIAEAVDLLLAASAEQSPALLAPQLPAPHYIADLARFMVHSLAPTRGVSIEFTHPRAGDKETEQLWSENEMPHPANASGLLHLDSPSISRGQLQSQLATLREAVHLRDLSASLEVLRTLVPAYTPGSTVLDSCATADPQVSDE
jgi:FlaA1/EpsC-like NDP-sugar epimerase